MTLQSSTAEQGIKVTSILLNILFFAALPALVLLAIFSLNPLLNFISGLLFYMGVSYLAGGFLFWGFKLMENWDNNFILYKRSKWSGQPDMHKVFYKVCLPVGFKCKPEDMVGFFYDMRNLVGGKRTKHQIYNLGKWYYNLNFDIIIKNKQLEIYMSFPYKRTDYILKTFKMRFPNIKLIQTKDPYTHWPKKWIPGKTRLGPYTKFHAFDFGLADTGPFPLGSPSEVPGSPLTELLESFLDFDSNVMFILQYVFRPYPTDDYEDKWKKQLSQLKSKLLSRSASFKYEDEQGKEKTATTGDLVTNTQKKLIDACEQKLNTAHFRVHGKVMIFFPLGKDYYGPTVEKMFRGYTGQTSGDLNILTKDWLTATDRFFFSNKNILDTFVGPIMDKMYHPKENIYRAKVQYDGLPDRDVDVSHPSSEFMVDVYSASSMFHFPSLPTFPEEFKSETQQSLEKAKAVSFEKLKNLRQKAVQNKQSQNSSSDSNNYNRLQELKK